MKILILGAKGGIARNFAENLYLVRDEALRTHADLHIESICEYSGESNLALLEQYCREAEFVLDFSAADNVEQDGTWLAASELLRMKNPSCAVFRLCRETDAQSCKEQLHAHKEVTGAPVGLIVLPEVFGKWDAGAGKSSVSELCRLAAQGQELPDVERQETRRLLYMGDLVELLLDLLKKPVETERLCCLRPEAHEMKNGEILDLLACFTQQQKSQLMPEISPGSFANKLFSVYLSYLPKEQFVYPLELRVTEGGEQYRVMTTRGTGQITINRYKPGTTLGLHWHNTKWEQYIVISGHGVVRERKVGSTEVSEFYVSGESIQAVQMIPGYVHSITNLSETEDLVILIWASEVFNPKHPDTNASQL